MKKDCLHRYVYLLFFSFMLSTSCKGQGVKKDSSLQIDDYVVEIFEDKNGNLWFGTMAKGAARYDRKTLTYLSTKDGLCENTVASIREDKEGNMWFGTHSGASKYDGKKFTHYWNKEGLHGPGCHILVDSKGNIWAGTNHGAFRYNGSMFSEFKIPNPTVENLSYKWEAGKIWTLMEDRKGNIWFARDGYGACKFDPTTGGFTHFTKKDGLCSNNVSCIVEDQQGNIWFGCLSSDFPSFVNEGGLCRYDASLNDSVGQGKTITQYPEVQGLSKNDIYTIYEDRSGNIWIGATGHGAYCYDGKNFTLFNESDRPDLIGNFMGIQSILEDRDGTLWFGFSGGLFRFNGKSFINITQDGPWK